MISRVFLIVAMLAALGGTTHAQRMATANELNAKPAEFDGKRVQVFVGRVEFPAMTVNKEKQFQDFEVSTREDGYGKARSEQAGKIAVRVPQEEVENFSRTHSARVNHSGAVQRERISGIFRMCKNRSGGYIDLTDGATKDIDPKAVR